MAVLAFISGGATGATALKFTWPLVSSLSISLCYLGRSKLVSATFMATVQLQWG
jgi:hypothetical protein